MIMLPVTSMFYAGKGAMRLIPPGCNAAEAKVSYWTQALWRSQVIRDARDFAGCHHLF